MRRTGLAAATTALALLASTSATAAPADSAWAGQANKVCTYWVAKVKQAFATPVTTAQLYSFAVKAKSLESQELAQLRQIPGPDANAAAALGAVKTDIAEVGAAITAWDKGDPAAFVTILKRYLNDNRPKSAFILAGARSCG
jgi:hypothetical protein